MCGASVPPRLEDHNCRSDSSAVAAEANPQLGVRSGPHHTYSGGQKIVGNRYPYQTPNQTGITMLAATAERGLCDAFVGCDLWLSLIVFWVAGAWVLGAATTEGRKRLKSLIRGADGRLSLSKIAPLMWTIALVSAFIVMATIAAIAGKLDASLWPELQEEYLLLLGGPFAAAVAAKGIVDSKLQTGALQKVNAHDASAGPTPGEAEPTTALQQLVGDDNGNVDLVDVQYLMFNLVALGFFMAKFVASPGDGLPQLPATLVGLTSAAALTYVTNKAVLRNAPVITSITPSSGRALTAVKIHGRNFIPPGTMDTEKKAGAIVTVGNFTAEVTSITNNLIEAVLPVGPAAGEVEIKVTTAAGATAGLFPSSW